MQNIYVCLDNIRSLFNVGAIFRTCSFFGVAKVILLGYSGKALGLEGADGSKTLHKDVKKTALGAENDLKLIFLNTNLELFEFAKSNGLKIIAFEQAPKSEDFNEWLPEDNSILVFGNEVAGVNSEILSRTDKCVEIISENKKHNSLNVEVTCGIALSKLYLIHEL